MGRQRIDGTVRQIFDGPITFHIWHEFDDDYAPDFLGEFTSKPEKPYFDMAAQVLVVDATFDDAQDLPIYEAYELGVDRKPVLVANFDPEAHRYERNRHRYVHKFQHAVKDDEHRLDHIRCCLEDGTRLLAMLKQDWYAIGIVVTAEVDGVSIVDVYDHALWGIDSDSDQSYFEEVANDLMSDIREELEDRAKKLQSEAQRLTNAARKLLAIAKDKKKA